MSEDNPDTNGGGCCGGCLKKRKGCCNTRREPLEFPSWVYISLNPCRIMETATYLGLIVMFLTIFTYATFSFENWEEIQQNVGKSWDAKKAKLDAMQAQANLASKYQDKVDIDVNGSVNYLKSSSFGKLMGMNFAFVVIMCGATIFISSKFLKYIVFVFIWVAIFSLTVCGFVGAYMFLDEYDGKPVDDWIRWGTPTLFSIALLVGYICVRSTIKFAVACLDSGLDFFWESCICSSLWVAWFLMCHGLWAFTCAAAYMYFKYRNNGQPAHKNDILFTKFNSGGPDQYGTVCICLLFCYLWGKTYIEYFSDVVYAGAIARKILHGERGTFLESIKIAITKLNGTVSFASFYIAIIKTLKYVLEPKEPTELSMMHGIPFYFFIMSWYNKFGAKYLKVFFQCLETVCNYINCYALIVASIYGDTLCGSGLRLFDLGLLKTLTNDVVVEFIIFLIIFFNSCLTSMIALVFCYFGCAPLNIVPAPNKELLFVVVFIVFFMSFLLCKCVFDPIIVLSRTTFVLHELEPELFAQHDPEHFAEFGHAVGIIKNDDETEYDKELIDMMGDYNSGSESKEHYEI